MGLKLSHIRVIIWDFDGTLFPLTPEMTRAMEEEQYRTIMRLKGWDKDRAKAAFWKVYPKETLSGNAAVGIICGISTSQAAIENEMNYDRLAFLAHDPKLVALFEQLPSFRHFILGNGVAAKLREAAFALGIPDGTFEEIVTSEVSGANKPDPAGFLYIMKKTGCLPCEHLMVGDREVVDLAPAKAVGMHTCLVTWEGRVIERRGGVYPELSRPGTSIDVAIPTIYDLPAILK